MKKHFLKAPFGFGRVVGKTYLFIAVSFIIVSCDATAPKPWLSRIIFMLL
tara:strand:- start:27766 stop:27915 length:150 start_codon:yes stop_codon:yes gene_type:complete